MKKIRYEITFTGNEEEIEFVKEEMMMNLGDIENSIIVFEYGIMTTLKVTEE